MTQDVDLLTEDPGRSSGSATVDDAPASLITGLNRALVCRRAVDIRGTDLFGVAQRCRMHVADIGPMLVLKLNAFGGPTGRRAPKDAYDILLAVTGFVGGYRAALDGFKAEKTAGNSGMATALACLEADFCDPDRDGPARAAAFHPGGAEERERVRQDMVTVGRALSGA